MIKLKTIYRTKEGNYIVVLRNPKAKWYELHFSSSLSHLKDFNYLLKECQPLYIFYSLPDIRCFACKIIEGEKGYYYWG